MTVIAAIIVSTTLAIWMVTVQPQVNLEMRGLRETIRFGCMRFHFGDRHGVSFGLTGIRERSHQRKVDRRFDVSIEFHNQPHRPNVESFVSNQARRVTLKVPYLTLWVSMYRFKWSIPAARGWYVN